MLFQQSPAPPPSNAGGPCAYTQLQRTPLSHICLIFEAALTQCYVNATTFQVISHFGLARYRLASFIAVLSIVALDLLLNTVATLAKSSIPFGKAKEGSLVLFFLGPTVRADCASGRVQPRAS